MYYVARLHPDLRETWDKSYKGGFFTRAEKEKQILEFYREKQSIPLCIDHCGATTCGFVVPETERIGRVVDLFNNEKGEMMVKMQLDDNHREYPRIRRGMALQGERWGVSVWIDKWSQTGKKVLSHVALTTDPLFASYDTFLMPPHSLFEHFVDREIAKQYYREKRGLCFAAPEFRKKLEGMWGKKSNPLTNLIHPFSPSSLFDY